MTAAVASRGRVLPRFPVRMFQDFVAFTFLVWGGYAAFVLVVLLAISTRADISISAWDQARQGAQWFGFGIALNVGWSRLPLHVTHGHTRREFMAQAAMFVAAFAAVLAAMVAVTYLAEAGLYGLTGWEHELASFHLFDSALEVHLVLVESWLLIALWSAGGLLLATAWYREAPLGGLAAVLVIVIAGVSGIAFNMDWGPFGYVYERLTGQDFVSQPVGVVVHLSCIALLLGLTWLVVRDTPVQNKSN